MPANLTYVWRPITGGRHAFPIDNTRLDADEEATAYCGAATLAQNLHGKTELAWIMEPTCMDCWQHLAAELTDRGDISAWGSRGGAGSGTSDAAGDRLLE